MPPAKIPLMGRRGTLTSFYVFSIYGSDAQGDEVSEQERVFAKDSTAAAAAAAPWSLSRRVIITSHAVCANLVRNAQRFCFQRFFHKFFSLGDFDALYGAGRLRHEADGVQVRRASNG